MATRNGSDLSKKLYLFYHEISEEEGCGCHEALLFFFTLLSSDAIIISCYCGVLYARKQEIKHRDGGVSTECDTWVVNVVECILLMCSKGMVMGHFYTISIYEGILLPLLRGRASGASCRMKNEERIACDRARV